MAVETFKVWLSSLKHPYDAFTTVPYADPPTRFQPAKLKSSGWSGIRDSKNYDATTCAQMDFHEVMLSHPIRNANMSHHYFLIAGTAIM